MLSDAIGDLLPVAAAVALSPIPIVGVVVVLGTPRARTTGPALAVGWVAGLAVVASVVVVVVSGADDSSATSDGVDGVTLLLGALFLVMAARQWKQRPRRDEEAELPGWMATIDSITPARALLLGAALSGANPKNLALTVAAAGSIAQAGLDTTETVIVVAVFVALGSLTVVGAVVTFLIAPERASRPLAALKQFMIDNSATIMMVVLLLLGLKLVGDGLGGVWR